MPLCCVSKANARPGSASTTVLVVDQRAIPRWLRPLKRAPTTGPMASPSQRPPRHSGLSRPMPAGSLSELVQSLWGGGDAQGHRIAGMAGIVGVGHVRTVPDRR